MKKKRVVWILVVAAVLAGTLYLLASSMGESGMRGVYYESETSRLGGITTYYNFTGSAEVRESQTVAAHSAAVVRDIYVEEGALVSAGDALARLSDGTVLTADIAGEVTQVDAAVGEEVAAGTALLEVVNFDSLEIVVKVDEYDVKAVSAGDVAIVTVDALGESFEGEILRVGKIARQSGDVSYFEATIAADGGVSLLPGMRVSAKVLNESVENAVIVSMDALQFDTYNQPYVVKRSGSEYVNVPVTVGLNDGTSVQILSGVSAGETVYVQRSVLEMMGMTGGRSE